MNFLLCRSFSFLIWFPQDLRNNLNPASALPAACGEELQFLPLCERMGDYICNISVAIAETNPPGK